MDTEPTMIQGDKELGGDAWMMTRLAKKLGSKIPLLCMEKVLYDGREDVSTTAIPKGVAQDGYAIYKRFTSMARVNMSKPIVDAVVSRQRPNGLRLASGEMTGETKADDMYYRCRMDVKIAKACQDTALYSEAFYLVANGNGRDRAIEVSPWVCEMDENEENAIMYSWTPEEGKERMTVFRLTRDEQGNVNKVYSRTAYREKDSNTLVAPEDDEQVKTVGDTWDLDSPNTWNPGTDWKWEKAPVDYPYALACSSLPIVRQRSADGMSQLSPHIATLLRIDQGVFNRMCIISMQAFRQRAIKGLKKQRYEVGDPQVKDGTARAGQKIDYAGLFAMGPAALWMLPNDAEIWESQQTSFGELLNAETQDIKKLAAESNTPIDILSPDVAGSAEGASLKREGIVFKVEQLNKLASDSIQRVLRMALVLDGDTNAAEQRYDMQWLSPNPRSWLELSQAATYSKGILPVKSIWKLIYNMSEQEQAEAEQNLADTSFQQVLSAQAAAMDTNSKQQDTGTLDGATVSSNDTLPDFDNVDTFDSSADGPEDAPVLTTGEAA